MIKSLGTWAAVLCALASLNVVASAADFFEVVTVTPSQVINHEVDSKGLFDDDVIETFLTGPQLFSHAVVFGEKAGQQQKAYLNWYKISEPAEEPRRTISVRDSLRGNDAHQITIQNAAYLLSPAQRITSGAPAPIPDGLNYFKAYDIIDGPLISQKVTLSGTFGPVELTATRAVLLCVPIEQWHHDERVTVKNASQCLLVYELLPVEHKLAIATIDQFGLNKLESEIIKWVAVPATVIEHRTADVK